MPTRRRRAWCSKATGCSPGATTDRDCYETTVETINKAIAWLAETTGGKPAFGGAAVESLPADERRTAAVRLMPALRGMIGAARSKVGHFDDSPAVMEFVNSRNMPALAAKGTSCPDHFLRTKIRPLVVDFAGDVDKTLGDLPAAVAAYRDGYAAYYERCKHADSPAIRDPNAVVYLVPRVGMITFAADKATARISAEFYVNAINVMRGATAVSDYVGLPEQEAFDIEYWLLEEAKLQRMPRPKSLAGRVAFITGGAGGIGHATATRLLGEGAAVVIADVDEPALETTLAALAASHGKDNVRAVHVDVTDEARVIASFADAVAEYGGLDIIVSNAGISSSAPIEDTAVEMWDRNMAILAKGYFLVSREAFRLMKRQKLGGADRVRVVQERPRRVGQYQRLFHRQGGGDPPRPQPGAGGRARADPGQRGQPRRGAARLEDLDRRMARAARRRLQHEAGRAGRALPQAQPAQAQRLSGRRRRGDLFPRLGPLGEIDRQHHQRRRGQRHIVHALAVAQLHDEDGADDDESDDIRTDERPSG